MFAVLFGATLSWGSSKLNPFFYNATMQTVFCLFVNIESVYIKCIGICEMNLIVCEIEGVDDEI